MKTKKTIQCYNVKGTPYLLPFGQGIMDHEIGLATNEMGKVLWEMLASGKSREELLQYMMEACEASAEDLPELQEDLNTFLISLEQRHFFEAQRQETPSPKDLRRLSIGPLRVDAYVPDKLFTKYLTAFALTDQASAAAPDQTVTFCHHHPFSHVVGEVLVRNEEVLILDADGRYVILPLQNSYVHEIHCDKNGEKAYVYCRYEEADACLEALFSSMRFAFLILAQVHGLCVMHSASLLYHGKAWLFSGHSGSGKSTHTALWHECYGTPYLNGDLNLLGIKNGQAICYGLPWCGTSGIFTPGEVPLGGITFLKQAPRDQVFVLRPDQFALSLAQRMITPNWTAAQMQESISMAEALCDHVCGFQLECTKNPSAAQVMKEAIDRVLTKEA